jgi:prepilin-type N-terminal cleavage/methylation domain-containing protein
MKRGFSLIEVMIASSMLLVGIAGIVFGTQIATQQHAHDRKVSVALLLAERRMEEVLMLFPSSVELADGRHPAQGFDTFDENGRPGGTAYRSFYTSMPASAVAVVNQAVPGTVVELTVAWDEAVGERSIQLRTVR